MPVTFQNRTAIFLWGFTVAWIGMLCAMTYVLVRDGAPDGHSVAATVLVAAVFWAAGIGLAFFAASKPCYFVAVYRGSRIAATWRYPHKVICKVVPRPQVEPALVVDSKDSDGDPYYFARAALLQGEPLDIAESHAREVCEKACHRFNEALFGHTHRG